MSNSTLTLEMLEAAARKLGVTAYFDPSPTFPIGGFLDDGLPYRFIEEAPRSKIALRKFWWMDDDFHRDVQNWLDARFGYAEGTVPLGMVYVIGDLAVADARTLAEVKAALT